MEIDFKKVVSIFNPYLLEKLKFINEGNNKFVQYTSAESAMGIIQNKEVWLRNVKCMNDFKEAEHGLECLLDSYRSPEGVQFKSVLEGIFPGITRDLESVFDSWIFDLRNHTYIACLSEHSEDENAYGRLSMWRAYGNKNSVALVLNKTPFESKTTIFNAYTYPVYYKDKEDFQEEFKSLIENIKNEREFIGSMEKEMVFNIIFSLYKYFVTCTKHPGFKEEKEWRVVYSPTMNPSEYMLSEVASIKGVPQEIHKFPLKNYPEHDFNGATVPEIIERIIIGPNEQQTVLGNSFSKLLNQSGVENPWDRIVYSGIPLR